MKKNRLEAFSDGVLAIIITIMVLELKVPHSAEMSALIDLWPILMSYVLSFLYIGIYWNNHHHLLHAVHSINGKVLWANMHLLFWLSLLPFATAWMGENHFAVVPTAIYGCNLLLAAIAYYILTIVLLASQGPESTLARALGSDFKGKISLVIYATSIPLSFLSPYLGMALYSVVAAIWLIPDQRIEKVIAKEK